MGNHRGKLLLLVFTILATFLLASCSQLSPAPHYSYTDSDFPLQLLWETRLDKAVEQTPLMAEGMIVILTGDMSFFSDRGNLVAIDQASGETLWIQENIRRSGHLPLLIYQDTVIIGNRDGLLSVYELHSGKLRWSEIVGGNSSSRVNDLAVAGNTVYSITDPTQIESRNLETGELQWRVGFDKVLHSGIPMRGPRLHFAHDRLYLLLGNPAVILDARTGEVLERLNISRRKGSANGDRMYLPEFAYDFPDMEITATYGVTNPDYSQEMCGEFDPSFAHFRFDGDIIYATGACGGVYKLDKDGIVLWEYEPSLVANPPMAILDDTLYVLFSNGEIHAIETTTGKHRGSLVLNRPLPGMLWHGDYSAFGVNAAGDSIIVTLNNQQVWAFSDKQ
jgi:outer membrane protein assembly factor BamB